MSTLGRCTSCGLPYQDCPISEPDAEWATDANGNHDGLCCEDCQHNATTQQAAPATVTINLRGNCSASEADVDRLIRKIGSAITG